MGHHQDRLFGELEHMPGVAAHLGLSDTTAVRAPDQDQIGGPGVGLFEQFLSGGTGRLHCLDRYACRAADALDVMQD
jgi:hypothetical protein